MKYLIVLFGALLFMSFRLPAQAEVVFHDTDVNVTTKQSDDVAVSGQTVTISAPIDGELFVAGSRIVLKDNVSRSIYGAGNELSLEAPVGYNAFLAGNEVTLKNSIDHDVYVASQKLVLDPSAHIKGTLHFVGQDVTLAGKIDGAVVGAAETVTSSAVVGKGMDVRADELRFSGGSIGENLRYISRQDAEELTQVHITGTTEKRLPPSTSRKNSIANWLLALLRTIVVGAALILVFARKVRDVSQAVMTHWMNSFILGLVVFVATPVALTLIMATVVGIPLAILGFVVYASMLYIAFILSQVVLGLTILKWLKQPSNLLLGLGIGGLIVSLPLLVPQLMFVIGPLAFLVVTLPTLGALALWWRTQLSEKPA